MTFSESGFRDAGESSLGTRMRAGSEIDAVRAGSGTRVRVS